MKSSVAKKHTGWRGSEEFWLDGAYKLLVENGVDAVKVMPLAKALDMSRTSFYWHFEDREALLDALIERWKKQNTGNLISQTSMYAETITEAMLNLFDCWVNPQLFDARMDFAIRNWAHQSANLKNILEQNDTERIEAIGAMFLRFGFDKERADVRAHTVYYTQIGYISMMVEEPVDKRFKKFPTYVETFAGSYPSKTEIARFMARHELT